jgi:hypothetical protein
MIVGLQFGALVARTTVARAYPIVPGNVACPMSHVPGVLGMFAGLTVVFSLEFVVISDLKRIREFECQWIQDCSRLTKHPLVIPSREGWKRQPACIAFSVRYIIRVDVGIRS